MEIREKLEEVIRSIVQWILFLAGYLIVASIFALLIIGFFDLAGLGKTRNYDINQMEEQP